MYRQLRTTFSEAAELYDRMRPGYPRAVFEELAEFGRLGPGSRVLEIGCGTGQATLPLAQRGYRVTAVELGAELAAIARRKLASFPGVEVVVSAFEDWPAPWSEAERGSTPWSEAERGPLPHDKFDAVVSATAFHWLDPAVRVARSAAVLRPSGTLAIIGTEHIAGGDTAFFTEAQACYERWDPSTPPGLRLQNASEIPRDSAELDQSGLFERVVFHRYEWTETYSASAYRDLLLTYSGHRALESDRREHLLACITELIEGRYGGSITKRYLTELRLAHRASPAGSRP
ncbi:MAG: methyltransferase domain-containing protein [Chloroflexi bacterium]|nr:MAG: methyltransferase domain-containing protein [Chloroflexota bacterium]